MSSRPSTPKLPSSPEIPTVPKTSPQVLPTTPRIPLRPTSPPPLDVSARPTSPIPVYSSSPVQTPSRPTSPIPVYSSSPVQTPSRPTSPTPPKLLSTVQTPSRPTSPIPVYSSSPVQTPPRPTSPTPPKLLSTVQTPSRPTSPTPPKLLSTVHTPSRPASPTPPKLLSTVQTPPRPASPKTPPSLLSTVQTPPRPASPRQPSLPSPPGESSIVHQKVPDSALNHESHSVTRSDLSAAILSNLQNKLPIKPTKPDSIESGVCNTNPVETYESEAILNKSKNGTPSSSTDPKYLNESLSEKEPEESKRGDPTNTNSPQENTVKQRPSANVKSRPQVTNTNNKSDPPNLRTGTWKGKKRVLGTENEAKPLGVDETQDSNMNGASKTTQTGLFVVYPDLVTRVASKFDSDDLLRISRLAFSYEQTLTMLFHHYGTAHETKGKLKSFEEVGKVNWMLCESQFYKFAREFGLNPKYVSKPVLKKIFRVTAARIRSCLLLEFVIMLAWCACTAYESENMDQLIKKNNIALVGQIDSLFQGLLLDTPNDLKHYLFDIEKHGTHNTRHNSLGQFKVFELNFAKQPKKQVNTRQQSSSRKNFIKENAKQRKRVLRYTDGRKEVAKPVVQSSNGTTRSVEKFSSERVFLQGKHKRALLTGKRTCPGPHQGTDENTKVEELQKIGVPPVLVGTKTDSTVQRNKTTSYRSGMIVPKKQNERKLGSPPRKADTDNSYTLNNEMSSYLEEIGVGSENKSWIQVHSPKNLRKHSSYKVTTVAKSSSRRRNSFECTWDDLEDLDISFIDEHNALEQNLSFKQNQKSGDSRNTQGLSKTQANRNGKHSKVSSPTLRKSQRNAGDTKFSKAKTISSRKQPVKKANALRTREYEHPMRRYRPLQRGGVRPDASKRKLSYSKQKVVSMNSYRKLELVNHPPKTKPNLRYQSQRKGRQVSESRPLLGKQGKRTSFKGEEVLLKMILNQKVNASKPNFLDTNKYNMSRGESFRIFQDVREGQGNNDQVFFQPYFLEAGYKPEFSPGASSTTSPKDIAELRREEELSKKYKDDSGENTAYSKWKGGLMDEGIVQSFEM